MNGNEWLEAVDAAHAVGLMEADPALVERAQTALRSVQEAERIAKATASSILAQIEVIITETTVSQYV